MRSLYLVFVVLGPIARAHQGFWHDAMYCRNGSSGIDNPNTADSVDPFFNLTKSEWWFHAVNNCDKFPPTEGTFLELPAGGSFSGEIAPNRAFTTLSWNGAFIGVGPGGIKYPTVVPPNGGCITTPNMHTTGEADTAGTAFAISYVSELADVTRENLVVFSIAYHTPWLREVSYEVPAALPACPPGGCICAWGWVPNHCGQSNMYMSGVKCKVTNAKSTIPVAPAKPPTWCEGNATACTKGAKQLVYAFQLDGNNVDMGRMIQADGQWASPGYNMKMGFANGAQNDIFGDAPAHTVPTTSAHSTSSVSKTTKAATTTKAFTTVTISTTVKPSTTSKAAATTSKATSAPGNAAAGVPPSSPSLSEVTTTVKTSSPSTKSTSEEDINPSKSFTTPHHHNHHKPHWHHEHETTSAAASPSAPADSCGGEHVHAKREAARQILKRHRKRFDAYDNAV